MWYNSIRAMGSVGKMGARGYKRIASLFHSGKSMESLKLTSSDSNMLFSDMIVNGTQVWVIHKIWEAAPMCAICPLDQ